MTNVLLFGASGNIGSAIARALKTQGYLFTAVVRNEAKAKQLAAFTNSCIIADITSHAGLENICQGYCVVISALGKSLSLKDKSKPSFYDIDFVANAAILAEAKKSSVQKFVYVSAFGAEKYQHLAYFKTHHDFSELLKQSGINYSIIKPVAVFSAFIDMIELAKKGMLLNPGRGENLTNPIYEGDLANICVKAIQENNSTTEAGGQFVYTRKQLLEIIQHEIKPGKKVHSIPIGIVKMVLPLIRVFNKNIHQKFAFFVEVIQHNLIAPKLGKMSFEEYIKMKTGE